MAKRQDWVIGIIIAASVLFFLLVLVILLSLSGDLWDAGVGGRKIALIEIEGTIYSSKSVVRQLKKYSKDSSIPAIVLRINSPGGGVAASQEIYEEIKKVRSKGKKVVASMGSVAASGGYYIAVATDTIVANPGSVTGSIGVIMASVNAERLLRKIGVDFEVVKSGKYKDTGSFSRQMTDEERRLLQGVIDDVYDQFVDAIVSERGISEEEVLSLADGRVFTGRQALQYGFVDILGTYEDAIDITAEMVGMEKEPRTVKERKRRLRLVDLLVKGLGAEIPGHGRASFSLQYLFPY